jgi:protein-tyrosine kinase
MSIIENAIDKLGQNADAAKKRVVARSLDLDPVDGSIERAIDRFEEKPGLESLKAAPKEADYQLVSVNLAKLRQLGMITPESEKSQLAEEVRLVKRPLVMNAFSNGVGAEKHKNLVMVTSSFPGEGKSFCSINLAMSIAMEMDHTVLLVDGDVSKPSIPSFLGFKAEKGLMDVLLDSKLDLADVLLRTNVEKLTILPAGQGHRRATELLASEAMTRLLEEMAERYRDRIIIFDSPPLLSASEARVLASHMGQIVVVVEAEKTTHEALKEALRQIESSEIVGLLLNKGNAFPGMDYYGPLGNYGY